MATRNEIIRKFDAYRKSAGEGSSGWYVGITNNGRRRLFAEHGVEEGNGFYTSERADSIEIAGEVEELYLDAGLRGGAGGGEENSTLVYIYQITSTTNENV